MKLEPQVKTQSRLSPQEECETEVTDEAELCVTQGL